MKIPATAVKQLNASNLDKLVQFGLDSAHRPQPELALSTALTTISLLCRNRYEVVEYGTRPNLYTLNVCPTGGGKEQILRTIKRIAGELKLSGLIAEGISSGPSLLRAISDTGTLLYWRDETWQMLESINSDRGSIHEKGMAADCMALYGAASHSWAGRRYADPTKTIEPIPNPYLVFCGATTPGRLMEALNVRQVGDGFLNRLIVFRSDIVPPIQRPKRTDVAALAETLRAIGADSTPERPMPVMLNSDAHELLLEYSAVADAKMIEENGALYARVFENSLRVAMLIAISSSPSQPVITRTYAERAVSIVLGSARGITEAIRAEHSDSPHDALCKRVMAMIRNGSRYTTDTRWGPYCMDGMMPRGKLLNATGVKTRELQEVIESLTERGEIFKHWLHGRGGKDIEVYALDETLP